MDVLCKGIRPLLAMLRIAPSSFVARNVRIGALLERHCLGVCCSQRSYACAFAFDGIDSTEPQLARLSRLLPRCCKAQGVAGTDSHVAQAPIAGVAEDPLVGAALGNAQIKPPAVCAQAGTFCPVDFQIR